MDANKGNRLTRVLWVVVGVLVLVVALAVGYTLNGRIAPESQSVQSAPVAGVDMAVTGETGAPDKSDSYSYTGAPAESRDALTSEEAASAVAAPDSMVIRTASLEMRVEAVEEALRDVRTVAARYDAQLTDLYIYGGSDDPVRPLAEGQDAAVPSPATATLTLRVPAEDLEKLTADIAEIGTVISQTSSASDVTEQYVDLAARMKNLKVEEARLRTFFEQAEKVSELLAVEAELSRVRGDIEALQAQIDYLERQVAMSTLTVTMSETGPIVRPESGDWGFLEAITLGIQAAAKVLTTLVTGIIALAPLLVLAGIVVLVVRAVRKRRGRSRPTSAEPTPSVEDQPAAAGDE